MALPTGAAIAGFVASVLSWYGLIRNGVQLVYDDYKAVKSFDPTIHEFIKDMERHQLVVEDWKLLWMIPEDPKASTWREGSHETHPFESLYELFWGDERVKVKETMELLRNRLSEAKDQLSPFASLTKEKWKVMNCAKKKWLIFVYIGTKKKHLEALREKIAKSLKDVQDDANQAWLRKRNRGIHEPVKAAEVRHEGICHLLIPLAMTTWEGLDGMREIYKATGEKYRTELELDVFGSSNTTTAGGPSRAILTAAEAKRVKLGILYQSMGLNETMSGYMNSSCIEKLEAAAQSGLSGPAAVLGVLEGKGAESAESSFVTTEQIQFSIRRLDHRRIPNTKRMCFWKTSSNAIRDIEIVRLNPRSRFRAAYELAQACLLFLDTAWFSKICSCELRCGMLPTDTLINEYEFALQIGIVHFHDRHLDDVEEACEHKNRLTQSLRRLGFMLIELYRAKISRIGCIEGEVAFISVDWDDGLRTYEKRYSLDEFLNSPLLPQRYRDALEYCMTAEFPDSILTARSSLERSLKEFYRKVVQPLQEQYHEVL
ncbi:hypothetical protein F5Y12DRAFT_362290 [Xylaria sp. FL1777]|nr:hypothetical protein F5Y12DRAFT_362290 [Xylaria sp. FL1777]